MKIIVTILLCIGAYMFGGFSTGLWVSRRAGKGDIRKLGSGSSGATNVLRILGLHAGLTTFAGDLLKGVIVALMGRLLARFMGLSAQQGACLLSVCAVVGHIYPALEGFKGGKGVATAGGTFLVISPIAAVATIACAVAVMALTNIVSVGSLAGAAAFLILAGLPALFRHQPWLFFFCLAILMIIGFAHRQNIRRLIEGKENKIDLHVHISKVKK
ncbi:MAG: glycerol-3-phosphate 1-O-acyltransferase PlsY [Oscillospiraceae bacterium]|jgi:glycerol-3-phosphate acyltransferase PlsY|nr:glycerol-3-phosphate 1-O-acyltransferase PlsY [Oscillospiraceae bacterium]